MPPVTHAETLALHAFDYSNLAYPPVQYPFLVEFMALNDKKDKAQLYRTGCTSLDEAEVISGKLPGSTIVPSSEEASRQAVEQAVFQGAKWLAEELAKQSNKMSIDGKECLIISKDKLFDLAELVMPTQDVIQWEIGAGGFPVMRKDVG